MLLPYFEVSMSCLLITLEPDVIVSFDDEKTKADRTRELAKQRARKFRISCHNKATYMIARVWDLFPKSGLDRVKADCLCDANINYSGHQLSLGFDLSGDESTEDFPVGTRGALD